MVGQHYLSFCEKATVYKIHAACALQWFTSLLRYHQLSLQWNSADSKSQPRNSGPGRCLSTYSFATSFNEIVEMSSPLFPAVKSQKKWSKSQLWSWLNNVGITNVGDDNELFWSLVSNDSYASPCLWVAESRNHRPSASHQQLYHKLIQKTPLLKQSLQ